MLGPDPDQGRSAVFWIRDSNYVLTAIAASVIMFFIARRWAMPQKLFAVADAFVLAAFTILGAEKALAFHAGSVNAVVLGVITGVAGGILRDVLVGEIPLVFRVETYFYATAAFAGAVVLVGMERWLPGRAANAFVGAAITLALRLIAIRWKLGLPMFRAVRRNPVSRQSSSSPTSTGQAPRIFSASDRPTVCPSSIRGLVVMM